MKNLQDPQYRIPQWALTAAIEGLKELSLRLEIEATVFQQMNTPEGRMLAEGRMEQALEYRKAYEFYLHL